MRGTLRYFFAFVLLLFAGTQAFAENRIALLLGNSRYETASLANPGNDVKAMGEALARLGFNVTQGLDLTAPEMSRHVRTFVSQLSTSDVALFFYAGHGLQYQGRNYMVGVDAKLADEASLQFETVSLDFVIDLMERTAKTSIVFYGMRAATIRWRATSEANSAPSRASGEGLHRRSRCRADRGPHGRYARLFSATPGSEASDGDRSNSPFTAALAKLSRRRRSRSR